MRRKMNVKCKIVIVGLCMIMALSACSMNNINQESMNYSDFEVEEQATDPDLVLLKKGSAVNICDGAMTAEIQDSYSGIFWESENCEEVKNVYYVKFTNCTDHMISTADVTLGDDEGELLFHIDMLRAGESVYVAEMDKKTAESESVRYIDSHIEYVDEDSIITSLVDIDSKNEKTLKVTNLTGDYLPLLRIYYGPYDESKIRISGTANSVSIDGMEANQEAEIEIGEWYNNFEVVEVVSTRE